MRAMAAVAALLSMLCVAQAAELKTFKSDDGYSFKYPADWIVQTREKQAEAARAAREHGANLSQADLSGLSCMIAAPGWRGSDSVANVCVAVTGRIPPVRESNLAKCRQELTDELRQSGMRVTSLNVRIVEVSGRKAYRFQYVAQVGGVGLAVQQVGVMVPAGARTYTLTCSAPDVVYTNYSRDFEPIIDSLDVAEGPPEWLLYAIGGGVIVIGVAILVVLVVVVVRWRRNARALADQPPPLFTSLARAAAAPAGAGSWPVAGPAMPPPLVPSPSPAEGESEYAAAAPSMPVAPPAETSVATAPEPAAEAIVVVCPTCSRQLRARPGLFGRTCRCPKCGTPITVP